MKTVAESAIALRMKDEGMSQTEFPCAPSRQLLQSPKDDAWRLVERCRLDGAFEFSIAHCLLRFLTPPWLQHFASIAVFSLIWVQIGSTHHYRYRANGQE